MLLHGAPSVPRPTLTLERRRSGRRQIPDASLALDVGQWATCVPVSARALMSVSSRWTMWTRTVLGPRRPTEEQ